MRTGPGSVTIPILVSRSGPGTGWGVLWGREVGHSRRLPPDPSFGRRLPRVYVDTWIEVPTTLDRPTQEPRSSSPWALSRRGSQLEDELRPFRCLSDSNTGSLWVGPTPTTREGDLQGGRRFRVGGHVGRASSPTKLGKKLK